VITPQEQDRDALRGPIGWSAAFVFFALISSGGPDRSVRGRRNRHPAPVQSRGDLRRGGWPTVCHAGAASWSARNRPPLGRGDWKAGWRTAHLACLPARRRGGYLRPGAFPDGMQGKSTKLDLAITQHASALGLTPLCAVSILPKPDRSAAVDFSSGSRVPALLACLG